LEVIGYVNEQNIKQQHYQLLVASLHQLNAPFKFHHVGLDASILKHDLI